MFLKTYFFLLIYFFICVIISCVMIFLSFFLINVNFDSNKMKSYECGYQNFGLIYNKYEIHYYKTAILFLIFDIEVIFLIPGNLNLFLFDFFGIIIFLIFILFLIYTLIYEYYNNVLVWN